MPPVSDAQRLTISLYRQEGLGYGTIARRVGVSKNTVRRLADPVYAERQRMLSREAKRRRTGTCEVCGGVTRYNGRDGPVSRICNSCSAQQQHNARVWTRERCIAGIQEYARRYGHPPVSTDWLTTTRRERTEPDGYEYPHVNVVQRECGSWANAIELAGFPRPKVGGNPLGRKSGPRPHLRVPEFELYDRIRAYYAEHGEAPSADDLKSTYDALRRYGRDWRAVLLSLGMTPHTSGRRRAPVP